MKMRRLLALVLSLCLLLGVLSGCNKPAEEDEAGKKDESASATKPGANDPSAPAAQTSAKYVYKTEFREFDMECEYIDGICVSGNYLYFLTQVILDPGSGDYPAVEPMPLTEELAEELETASVGLVESDEPGVDLELPDGATMPVESPELSGEETGEEEPVTDTPAEDAPAEDVPTEEPSDPPMEVIPEYIPPTYGSVIYRVDLSTYEIVKLEGYEKMVLEEEGWEGDCWISMVQPGPDGSLWIYDTLNTWKYDLPEDFDPAIQQEWEFYVEGPTQRRVQQFSPEGEILKTVMIDGSILGENAYFDVNFVDALGNIYCYSWETGIHILNDQGQLVKTIEMGDDSGGYLTTFCGQAAVQFWTESGNNMQLIDPETLELDPEPLKTPANGYTFMTSYDEAYDYYYQLNYNVYGYKAEEQVSEKIVDWLDCDVDINGMNGVFPLPDGRVLALLNEWDEETGASTYSGVFLTRADPSTVKPKTVLTLACMYLDWDLRTRIMEFNRANEEYRIVVNDYSQYATDEDYLAGITKLNTEIISGKVPDLLYTSVLPIAKYAGQGLLVDLLPLIDTDPELSRDALMTRVIDAACIEGKLYHAFAGFYMDSQIALEKVVGEYDQWTLAEVKDAMTKLQPDASVFGVGWTRENVLRNCINRSLSTFVNWDTGVCTFDSQDFREMLEFANSFPEEFNYEEYEENGGSYVYGAEALNTGMQLMSSFGVYNLSDYLWNVGEYQNLDLVFVGYPSAAGNHNSFSLNQGLSISSTCANQDVAWQFVRQLFTEEYQRENPYGGLPTNAVVFQEQLKEQMTIEYETDENGQPLLDENGEKIPVPKAYIWQEDGTDIELYALTQEQADQIMALYESIDTATTYDEEIYKIVAEEAAGYFSGQIMLDEIVKRIQNRVSLYVAEQK